MGETKIKMFLIQINFSLPEPCYSQRSIKENQKMYIQLKFYSLCYFVREI